jgi:transcription antitermination factor NusA-like protein
MIEKLEHGFMTTNDKGELIGKSDPSIRDVIEKLNEIIDVVNKSEENHERL